jgi:hypothetical protein
VRGTCRYEAAIRQANDELRQKLRELAMVRRRFGYRRLHAVLRREGWAINHKRIYRLYVEEKLWVRKRNRRRRVDRIWRVGTKRQFYRSLLIENLERQLMEVSRSVTFGRCASGCSTSALKLYSHLIAHRAGKVSHRARPDLKRSKKQKGGLSRPNP